MAKVFYARVSSRDQDLDVQLAEAKRVKADKVFAEKRSGLDGDRPQLRECLDYLRDDALYRDHTCAGTSRARAANRTLKIEQISSDIPHPVVDHRGGRDSLT